MGVGLVSVPGYGHGLLPGALPTLSAALAAEQVESTCYFLCAEFSDLLLRRHPQLVDTDREIAQWLFTYHEAHFYGLLKGSSAAKELFPLPDGFEPSRYARQRLIRSPRAKRYCAAMTRHLRRRAREIARAGHRVVGFSCSQNSQFYTALFVALEVLRTAENRPQIVFGGGLFDAGNVARFAAAFPMIDAFVARDGVAVLLDAARREPDVPPPARSVIGPPPRTSAGWSSVIPRAQRLAPMLLRNRGYFQVVVSASRGCSWAKCKFCCHAVRERLNYLSPEDLTAELGWLNERYGITDVLFGDLEMNPSIERVRDLTDALKRLPDSMRLWGLINSRAIGSEVFWQFREARFTHLQCGIEALSQPILDRMRKGTTVLNNVLAMRLAHETGLEWFFAPLLEGFVGETPDDVRETLAAVRIIPHLLRDPVDAEVIGCYRHRGAWLGSKLVADEPELGSSRWFDPDEIAVDSPNAKLWDQVRRELKRARDGRAFLLAKCGSAMTRIVDGRNGRVLVHDFTGAAKRLVDGLLEAPMTRAEVVEIAGREGWSQLLALVKRKLVMANGSNYLAVAVRTSDLGSWDFAEAEARQVAVPKRAGGRPAGESTVPVRCVPARSL
jgi:hypothetical protein